jgi:hypothetical protein
MTKEELEQLSEEELEAKYEEVLGEKPGNRKAETQIEEILVELTEDKEQEETAQSLKELQERLVKLEEENKVLKSNKKRETKSGKVLKGKEPEIMTEDQRIALQKREYAKKKNEQLQGIKGKTMTANMNDDFEILEEEAGHIHILLTKKHYQASANDMVVDRKIQKIWPNMFKTIKRSIMSQHDEVEVIHCPEEAKKLIES